MNDKIMSYAHGLLKKNMARGQMKQTQTDRCGCVPILDWNLVRMSQTASDHVLINLSKQEIYHHIFWPPVYVLHATKYILIESISR